MKTFHDIVVTVIFHDFFDSSSGLLSYLRTNGHTIAVIATSGTSESYKVDFCIFNLWPAYRTEMQEV